MYIDTFMTDWGPVKVSPLEAAIIDYGGTRFADCHLNTQAASIRAACDKLAKWRHDRA